MNRRAFLMGAAAAPLAPALGEVAPAVPLLRGIDMGSGPDRTVVWIPSRGCVYAWNGESTVQWAAVQDATAW